MAILASPPPRLFAIWSTADCEISVVLTVEVAKEKKAVDGIDVPAHATQQTSADREMLLEAVDLEQRVSHGGGSLSTKRQSQWPPPRGAQPSNGRCRAFACRLRAADGTDASLTPSVDKGLAPK